MENEEATQQVEAVVAALGKRVGRGRRRGGVGAIRFSVDGGHGRGILSDERRGDEARSDEKIRRMLIESLTVGPLEENCHLVGASPRCVVVDPGAESDRIFATIGRLGLVPEKILLTHGHVDHIAHCAHVAERYGIGLWVHRADLPYLEGPQWPELEAMLGARPCPKPERFVEEGEALEVAGLELGVIHTPGHTPGGICFVHEPSRTMLVGDTLFAGSVGRTDLPGGDWATLERSIKSKLFTLDGDYRLLTGHGPDTTLAVERLENPFVGAGARISPW